jgi:hypothetical protein
MQNRAVGVNQRGKLLYPIGGFASQGEQLQSGRVSDLEFRQDTGP